MLRRYLHSLPHWLINSVTASRIDEQSTAQECPSRNPHTGFERYTRGRGLSRWDSHRVHVHLLLRGCRINEGDQALSLHNEGNSCHQTLELAAVQASRGLKLKLRRQVMYF